MQRLRVENESLRRELSNKRIAHETLALQGAEDMRVKDAAFNAMVEGDTRAIEQRVLAEFATYIRNRGFDQGARRCEEWARK